jgi:hypothetical protein
MSGLSTHGQGLPFAVHRYWQAIDFLLALPDNSPAPEAPVPVDPDIIDNLNVGKSANNHNVRNISHLNCFTDNCDGFDYVSKLHDFIDGVIIAIFLILLTVKKMIFIVTMYVWTLIL